MIAWVVFLALSFPLAVVSRRSLRVPGSHGFYRFFAWECILGLIVLNVSVWFSDPFALHQIISWILLCCSILPLVMGVHLLRRLGRAEEGRSEEQLLAFEQTTRLVTTGLYGYIRHPLYSSLLLLAWGVFFKDPAWPSVILAGAATMFLYATGKADEKECVKYFGRAYTEYMTRSKMFIPFVW